MEVDFFSFFCLCLFGFQSYCSNPVSIPSKIAEMVIDYRNFCEVALRMKTPFSLTLSVYSTTFLKSLKAPRKKNN